MQYAYDKASTITMGYPVTIRTHHKITALIEKGKFVLTNSRLFEYLTLLTFPDVNIEKCFTVNPADRIQHDFEGTPHDCVADSLTYTKLRPDLLSEPMIGADEDIFVDGSCFRDHLGNHARFAVVRQNPDHTFAVIQSSQFAQPCSAQLAELLPRTILYACRRRLVSMSKTCG